MKNYQEEAKKGSILILVLWALGLLTVFAVYLGFEARQRLEFLSRMETRNKLYYIACAGVKQAIACVGNFEKDRTYIARNDPWSDNSAFLNVPVGDDGWFSIGYSYSSLDFSDAEDGGAAGKTMNGAEDLESRLNVNTAELNELCVLIKEAADVDIDTAGAIACGIVDWRDEDSLSLNKGAENEYYRGLREYYDCKNSPFQGLEELRYVKGVTPDIYLKIRPYLTVYGSGRVNINTASRKALLALGLSENVVKKIIKFRAGDDGTSLNRDDRAFTSTSEVVAQLSQIYALSASEAEELSNVVSKGKISTFSETFLLTSRAHLNSKQEACQIECVFKKNPVPDSKKAGTIISWRVKYKWS